MSAFDFVLQLSFMMTLSGLLIVVVTSLCSVGRLPLSPRRQKWFCEAVFAAALLSPAVFLLPADPSLVFVSAQNADEAVLSSAQDAGSSVLLQRHGPADLNVFRPEPVAIFLLLFLFGVFLGIWGRDLIRLRKITREAFLWLSVGHVRIFVSELVRVPYAYREACKAIVVIPSAMVEEPELLKVCLLHELQHHRQGDTRTIAAATLCKVLFFWNPIVLLALRRLNWVQELACDEALIVCKRIGPAHYARCLFKAAGLATDRGFRVHLVSSMSVGVSAADLKRRLLMLEEYGVKRRGIALPVLMIVSLGMLTTAAFAVGQERFDRKVTEIEIGHLLSRSGRFPLEVNESILAQLNKYVGTPGGRAWIRASLQRRAQNDDVFRRALDRLRLPQELLAVALVESGFRNLTQEHNPVHSAGIWQFIPQTARRYGLRVNERVDERLDVQKSTAAALNLLSDLHGLLGDWRLAVLGYNGGLRRVEAGMAATGSRDPWVLVAAGYENDKGYLSRVMAGALILTEPSLFE